MSSIVLGFMWPNGVLGTPHGGPHRIPQLAVALEGEGAPHHVCGPRGDKSHGLGGMVHAHRSDICPETKQWGKEEVAWMVSFW